LELGDYAAHRSGQELKAIAIPVLFISGQVSRKLSSEAGSNGAGSIVRFRRTADS